MWQHKESTKASLLNAHVFNLAGQVGIGHVRYPTAGSASAQEAQPLFVNSPLGIYLQGMWQHKQSIKTSLLNARVLLIAGQVGIGHMPYPTAGTNRKPGHVGSTRMITAECSCS
jgi:glutamine phosphoribosylpyrophosphate amidotransferase